MKKIVLFIIFIFLLNLNYQKENISTFKEKNDNQFYILEFPNNNLSTNNFLNYFSDIQVIWVELNIKLNVKKRYNYININQLRQSFFNELEENNYKSEAINYQISGVIINKIMIYSNKSKINNLNIENIIVNF